MHRSVVDSVAASLYRFPRLRAWSRSQLTKGVMRQMRSVRLREVFRKYHDIDVGMFSYGGCFEPQNIPCGSKIGRYCSFAPKVYIYGANHPFEKLSQHPFFYRDTLGFVEQETIERTNIVIGNDVWIGQNAILTARVNRVGDGAVIGAGSVVTKDVPDFAIVAGNPARIIRFRFPEKYHSTILDSKWWDLSIEKLAAEHRSCFRPSVTDETLQMIAAIKSSKTGERDE